MPRTSDKREKLLDAATLLIYKQGFNQTSLADIAEESGVPLGNVYYYFKTKDDLARAVIDGRRQQFRNNFDKWDELPDPRQRLFSLLKAMEKTRADVANYGCPIGSMCLELNKEQSAIAPLADDLLKEILKWVSEQFKQMGCNNSQDLGIRFIVTLQGASMVANALHKSKVITQQFEQMRSWIKSIK